MIASSASSRPVGPSFAVLERARRASLVLFLRAGVLVLGAVAFVALAGDVLAGGAAWFDAPVLGVARGLRSDGVTQAMRAVTWFGEIPAMTALATTATLILWFARLRPAALFVAASAAGAGALNAVLKHVFLRPRPLELVPLATAPGYSFPSGHAMASAAIFGALAAVVVVRFPRFGWAAVALAVAAAGAIGLSRIYLGVHYPSDVIAGWALGVSWPLWLQPALLAKSSVRPSG